jgi:hypothetical protein
LEHGVGVRQVLLVGEAWKPIAADHLRPRSGQCQWQFRDFGRIYTGCSNGCK